MMMICQIFLPLDRGYVLNTPLILSIWDLSLDLFKAHIISNKTVQTRCVNGLLMMIERERNGELVDRSLIKNLLNMLYKLQVSFDELYMNANQLRDQSKNLKNGN